MTGGSASAGSASGGSASAGSASGNPWPRGSATGLGSLPGTDADEAARRVFGQFPQFAHLPELPARGVGADMIGRSATMLADLPVQLEASGWRFTARPGSDLRRARDWLARDLDAVEQAGIDYVGAFKVQVAGPLTLAAGIELVNGHSAVADAGAVREISQALAEGVRHHLAEVARRLPGATIVLQVDEPSVPAVLGGRIPTPSGYGTVRSIKADDVEQRLATVISVAQTAIVHCCASDAPLDLFRRAGAAGISVDVDQLVTATLDEIGEAIQAGCSIWLGLVGIAPALNLTAAAMITRVQRLWDRLSFDPDLLAESVVLTPSCGLAGATPDAARRVMTLLSEAAGRLREL